MHKKLVGYLFLSVFSFSFFSVVLHASAQTPDTPLSHVLSAQTENKPPTPTLYVKEVAPEPTVVKEQQRSASPTPTIYIAPPVDEPVVLSNKAMSTDEVPEPTAIPTQAPVPTQVPTEAPAPVHAGDLESLFDKYSSEFNVDKEDMKRIAKCESGFNPEADTGLYAGMYQFHADTWASTRNAMGLDPNPDLRKNAEESIRTAAFKIAHGGRSAWPNC